MTDEARQRVLDGTLNESQRQALIVLEKKDDLAMAKARLDRALEKLDDAMCKDELSEVYAKGVRFRRDIRETIKIEGWEKPAAAGDVRE